MKQQAFGNQLNLKTVKCCFLHLNTWDELKLFVGNNEIQTEKAVTDLGLELKNHLEIVLSYRKEIT